MKTVPRRPITDLERERVAALLGAKVHAYDGFARRLILDISANYERGLSEGEAKQLDRVAWTYRRQIPARLHPHPPTQTDYQRVRQAAEQHRLDAYLAKHRP